MSEKSRRDFELKDLPRPLLAVVGIAILTACIMLIAYLVQFGWKPSVDHNRWGTFGDFMGGILNPLFAFAALIALLCTLALQKKELSETREALQEQQKVLQIQTFEATFFKLLDRIETYLLTMSCGRRDINPSTIERNTLKFIEDCPIRLFDPSQGLGTLDDVFTRFRMEYGAYVGSGSGYAITHLVNYVLLVIRAIQLDPQITPPKRALYVGLLKPILNGMEWYAIALHLLYESKERAADLRFLQESQLLDGIPPGWGVYGGLDDPWPLITSITGLPAPAALPPVPESVANELAS